MHETGHSMHSSYTCEVALPMGDYSTLLPKSPLQPMKNQLEEVEDDANPRFAILNHFLMASVEPSSVKLQFVEFEHAIHKADQEGTVVSIQRVLNLWRRAFQWKILYGLSKEDNPEIQYEWARILTSYYNYYVFQYSTGFAAASALAEKIVHGTQEDRDKYIDYLKAGNSWIIHSTSSAKQVDMEKEDYLDAACRLNEFEALV